MAELSESLSAYEEPLGETTKLSIADDRCGRNCFVPVSNCHKTRTVSEPPERR